MRNSIALGRAGGVGFGAAAGSHQSPDARRGFHPVAVGAAARHLSAPRHLTRFYLMIALGGAIGAMLVGILAPVIFSGVYELGFAHCALAALWLYQMRGFSRGVLIAGACVLPFTGVAAIFKIKVFTDKTVLVTRNFYGVLRVQENDNGDMDYFQRTLTDGTTVHGEQFPKGKNERVPTTYYTANSGIGRTLRAIGLKTACIVENSMENRLYPSGWVLLTRSAGFLDVDNIRKATIRIPARPEWRMWTDDFSNLFQVLK